MQPAGVRFFQQGALAGDAPGRAQQAQQVPRQYPQRPGPLPSAIALEPGVIALHVDLDDLAQRRQQAPGLARLLADLAARRLHAGQPGGAGLPVEVGFHPPRPERRADERSAEDAQADLRAARHGLVEHAQRLQGRRQADDRHRIAGQHEGVGNVVAQGGGRGGAEADPEGNGEQEQPGRLGEQGDHHHRHRRPDQGAEQAEDTLGDHHAGERLGDDEYRHQRPLRLVQIEPEGAPERQAARQEGLYRELERQRIRRKEGLQRGSHAISRRWLGIFRMVKRGSMWQTLLAS
ncbi:hypothetical protein D3C76_753630 [compost metagenome]